MKRTKFLLVALVLIGSSFCAVSCTDDGSQTFDNIKQKLGLTEEQAAKVKPIFDEQIEKAKEALKPPKMEPGESPQFKKGKRPAIGEKGSNPFDAKLLEIAKETEAKLTPLLSAAQIEEYNKIVSEALEKIKSENKPQGGPGGGGPGRGGGMQRGMPPGF